MGPGLQGAESDPQEAGPCLQERGLHLLAVQWRRPALQEQSLDCEGRGLCPQDLGARPASSGRGLRPWAPPGRACSQARGGSGSTLSQIPFSVRRMSSGFRRTLRVRSTLRRKRSSVSATTTRISAMAKLCPMQFLEEERQCERVTWDWINDFPL